MLKYGEHEIDQAKLPQVTVDRMLQTACNHILGNEVASQVVGEIRNVLKGDGKAADVTTDAIKAYRADESHDAQIATWEREFRAAKIAAMLDGTLTVRAAGTGGSVRDPVEAAMRSIAKMEIVAILAKNGAKFPGKDATVTIGQDTLSGDDLITRRLASHEDRLRKAAEQKVAQDRRLRDNAAKAAGDGGNLAESLGL